MVVPGTSILEVTISLPDRAQAVAYLNVLLDTYAERNRYEINQDVIEGKRFLEERLALVESDLAGSQKRLVDFMLANADRLSLGTDEIAATQRELQDVERRLAEARAAIRVAGRPGRRVWPGAPAPPCRHT